jgi:hypothetical protein
VNAYDIASTFLAILLNLRRALFKPGPDSKVLGWCCCTGNKMLIKKRETKNNNKGKTKRLNAVQRMQPRRSY